MKHSTVINKFLRISTQQLRPIQFLRINFCRISAEIKLHQDNKNKEKGFKLSKAWNHSTRLLKHSNTHIMKIPRRHRDVHAQKKTK
jgi:hypothetical protein